MKTLLLLFVIAICACVVHAQAQNGEEEKREKRSYYGGYDMYGDDYWYAGRIIGLIFGIFLLLACCCLPCICLAGIWFLGWFGLRERRRRAAAEIKAGRYPRSVEVSPSADWPAGQTQTVYSTPPRVRNVIVDPVPDTSTSRNFPLSTKERDQIIYQAEDRYYTSSSAPTEPYRSNKY